ncbi:MAG: hypothetical protein A4E42_00146 [Methanoregulaceae archaeon PtaU1.Bin222]|nr:MAG: hypothetical protein A4E42_00146 [Methanoregulaceae archaeon PtaU1.Bin222]
MVGSEGLAERAGVVGCNLVILHPPDARIAFGIDPFRLLLCCQHLLLVRDERHCNSVEELREVHPELACEQLADVLDLHAFCHSFLRDPHPDEIALGNVPGTFAVIDKIMDAAFKHRFVVLLHCLPCYFDDDPERIGRSFLHGIDLRADDRDFPIFDLGKFPHPEKFKSSGPAAAELHVHLFFPYALSLKRR